MKTTSLILAVGTLLGVDSARQAWATDGPLPLHYAPQGLAIHNGVTTLAIETSYGTNLMGLAFTGTTTYDFYSTPLTATVNLPTSDEGKGIICMQNASP